MVGVTFSAPRCFLLDDTEKREINSYIPSCVQTILTVIQLVTYRNCFAFMQIYALIATASTLISHSMYMKSVQHGELR